ncbi:RICIN domain-containing protein [Dyadobacter frigoris]|uniref:T9SS type A sorting domain-containing protein n=1 Tax=Dyadobacter frigoris TaxID=2576211 RepID=A0A4U6CWA7_9BACT|nr:RICIN domain-containing protein [Dyadobacter frigoris]TKT87977.1 T9SS type A sorting domain-containing protein [Dyadobacter frigoris]
MNAQQLFHIFFFVYAINRKLKTLLSASCLLVCLLWCTASQAQTFVHPGGLHTLTDLNRMKAKVAAGEHPWIDSWNVMITDWQAQNTYTAVPYTNIGGSGNRQRASQDAHAAYLNTIRWYVTGDVSYADCAVRICNAWANTVNQVASGELFQLPINNFMQAAELLRTYPGWAAADIAKFKTMALTYFYPACHNSLAQCGLPSSWDSPFASSIMGIGVFCDDAAKFNEAVTYFKTGAGNGSILKVVSQPSGQVTEMGRDMVHANIGLSCLAEMCQTAKNQTNFGLDLYGYSSNRLLAGFEYYCQYNLNHPVTWVPTNTCDNDNFLGISYYNARGFLTNNPTFEMVYNHYGVVKGLSTPYVKAMAQLARPETQNADFFGYGTFTHSLNAAASPYLPYPVPATPTALVAKPAASKVYLEWTGPGGDVANGYNILRSTTAGGPYTSIGSWTNNTLTTYTDWAVTNGTTYYYKVSANNQSGTSGTSGEASAQPVATTVSLPTGWTTKDIGSTTTVGSAGYGNVVNNTFVVNGSGSGMGGTSDSFTYTYGMVTGDFIITAHMAVTNWAWTGGDKAGLQIRESLDPGARMLTVYQGELGNRFTGFLTRATAGVTSTFQGGNKFSFSPWYRLQRSGNIFTAYQSTDGITYQIIGTSTLAINSTCYVGLAVCAGATGSFSNVTYENVAISGATLQPVPDGTYKIIARHSGKALDVSGASTADGANVQQWPYGGGGNQQWTLTHLGGGQYKIIGVGSGKSLDVANNSTADGANVDIWSYSGNNNQRFTFASTGGGYYRITPVHSGKALDVAGISTADGANVHQWSYNGTNNQQWLIVAPATATARIGATEVTPEINTGEVGTGHVIIYPNPAADQVTVRLGKDFEKGAMITVRDSNGRLLSTLPVKGAEHVLKLGKLSFGIYFIEVSDGTKSITKKLLRN